MDPKNSEQKEAMTLFSSMNSYPGASIRLLAGQSHNTMKFSLQQEKHGGCILTSKSTVVLLQATLPALFLPVASI